MKNDTIEGTWISRYAYGKGAASQPHANSHRIRFTLIEGKWMGKSLPDETGSEVTITLTQNGSEFAGTWQERTSPSGYYQGKEFKGLILLLLQNEGTELNGMWLGASSSANKIKAGLWTFSKEDVTF